MGGNAIRRYWPPERFRTALINERLNAALVDQAYRGRFTPLLADKLPSQGNHHQGPIHKKFRFSPSARRQAGGRALKTNHTLILMGPSPVKLYLGCGDKRRPGYVNVDKYVSAPDVQRMDLFNLPYADGEVDVILTEHMLEHLGKFEVPAALREWRRVLKPCGRLSMNLPNLQWCLEQWLSKPEKDRWGWQLDAIFGLQTHPGEFHKTGFTAERLRGLLADAGFELVNITDIWSHGQSCLWVDAHPLCPIVPDPNLEPERQGWRMTAATAGFEVAPHALAAGVNIVFEVACSRPGRREENPFRVRVFVNGNEAGDMRFAGPAGAYTLRLPVRGGAGSCRVVLACETSEVRAPIDPEIETGRLRLDLKRLVAECGDFSGTDRLQVSPKPLATVIVPLCNGRQLNPRFIADLAQTLPTGLCKVVVILGPRQQDAPGLRAAVGDGASVLQLSEDRGFAYACNQAAFQVRSRYLVFLDPAIHPREGWIEALIGMAEADARNGAVGGMLLNPDGTLLEAGRICFGDGSERRFGFGDDPGKDIYRKACEVDGCSADMLLVRRDLFLRLGGFDERYAPRFFEHSDLCFGLRQLDARVLYCPEAVGAYRPDEGTANSNSPEIRWLSTNKKRFVAKWRSALVAQPDPPKQGEPPPATADRLKRRVICQTHH